MFDNLSDKFQLAFRKLSGKAELSEKNITEAMAEIRIALIEADVSLAIIKKFIEEAKAACLGEAVLKSVSPSQQAIKVVNDLLVELMGKEAAPLELSGKPAVIMMVGLHGAGKTTTTGKLAARLKKDGKKVLLVAADVYRPAAINQLEFIANDIGVNIYSDHEQKDVVKIVQQAMSKAKSDNFDIVLLDTAGRLQIDTELVNELVLVKKVVSPSEILLVADAALGQQAISVAEHFHAALSLTGAILTKLDGDARGGAALSIREVTGVPVKFVGTGEKMSDIDVFYPERMASRILGMGDVVSLVEKAAEQISEEEAMKLEEKMMKNKFDLQDFLNQLNMLKKMGGLGFLLKMLPGGKKLQDALSMGEGQLKSIEAMIQSMTKKEKQNPEMIDLSRKKRIAKGSGTDVKEVTQLVNRFNDMKKMMSTFAKMPGFGGGGGMMPPMGGGGMMPPMMPSAMPSMPSRGEKGVVGVSRDSGLSDKERKRLKKERQKKKKK
ncbi:MAG: signal recognition particle protein [Lentisphaeria bacterium]